VQLTGGQPANVTPDPETWRNVAPPIAAIARGKSNPCRSARPGFAGEWSVVVVVEAAGDDGDHVVLDVVDEPVLLGDPA
jgi:hypothetical protein